MNFLRYGRRRRLLGPKDEGKADRMDCLGKEKTSKNKKKYAVTPEVGKYLLQVENSRYLVPSPHRPYSSWQVAAHAITWLAPGSANRQL